MPSITTFLDPTQMPARTQDQQTFDNLYAAMIQLLPKFGAEINALAANLNSIAAGGAYDIPYTYDTATADADPGAGKLRLDNAAAQNAATWIYVDTLSSAGQDVTALLTSFGGSTSGTKGQVKLTKQGDTSRWIVANITAVNAGSGYMKLQISAILGSQTNPFANGDALILQYQRTGDKGDQGVPGAAGNLVLIGSYDVSSAVAQIDFLNVNPGTYDHIVIDFTNLTVASAGNLTVQLAVGGALVTASNYYNPVGDNSNIVGGTSTTSFAFGTIGSASTTGMSVSCHVRNCNGASGALKGFGVQGHGNGTALVREGVFNAGAVTGFRASSSGGNFTGGSVRVYGVKKS